MPKYLDPVPRFWNGVTKTDGCWLWKTPSSTLRGYGCLSVYGKVTYAHRFSYELNVGKIPPGIQILHLCDNCACVRPDHLALGTQKDNIQDMLRKGRGCTGDKQYSAKLTWKDVEQIRARYALGDDSQNSLARAFGVPQPHIKNIIKFRRWNPKYERLGRSG